MRPLSGSEVLWGGRVVWGCEIRSEVLLEHGVGNGKREEKQSRCHRAPVALGGIPPRWLWPSGEDTGDVG